MSLPSSSVTPPGSCVAGRVTQVLLFRSLAAAAVIAAAYLPGLVLMLRQLGRVREDYWTEPLSVDLVERTFLEFISPVTRASDPAFWGGFCLAAFLVAVAIVGLTANRDESLVLAVAVLPMVFTAVVTLFVSRVWDGHFFRFSQLFLLFVLALAVSKVIPRPVQGATLAVLVLGMVVASVDFWINREIPTRPGMRACHGKDPFLRKGNELIVANSNIHYFPAKYYVAEGRSGADPGIGGTRILVPSFDPAGRRALRGGLPRLAGGGRLRPRLTGRRLLTKTILPTLL